jgi:hypothetical protein
VKECSILGSLGELSLANLCLLLKISGLRCGLLSICVSFLLLDIQVLLLNCVLTLLLLLLIRSSHRGKNLSRQSRLRVRVE